MISLGTAFILSLIQGVTEFLPLSSSGHLLLAFQQLNIPPSLTLSIILNTATFFSVLLYFRKVLPKLLKDLPFIIVGTLPALVIAWLFKNKIDTLFAGTSALPYFFLISALFMFLTRFIKVKNASLTLTNSLLIGFFQALAILPGVSRSGSTIFAGLLTGLSPLTAFNFSFGLYLPASLGAVLLDLPHLSAFNFLDPYLLLTFVLTFLIGLLALHLLRFILKSPGRLWIFSLYLIFISLIVFVASF